MFICACVCEWMPCVYGYTQRSKEGIWLPQISRYWQLYATDVLGTKLQQILLTLGYLSSLIKFLKFQSILYICYTTFYIIHDFLNVHMVHAPSLDQLGINPCTWNLITFSDYGRNPCFSWLIVVQYVFLCFEFQFFLFSYILDLFLLNWLGMIF